MNLSNYKITTTDPFLFCGYRDHDYKLYKMLTEKYNMVLINKPENLTYKIIKAINPKMIFFPNWSWKVPKEIVDEWLCVCYHEGDLPIGRGGSPIQNHIVRGFKNTKSTTYIMNDKIDAGPILCKRDLDLSGSLNEIFERIIQNNYDMTVEIIEENPKPVAQDDSKSVYFDRRKPEDSEIQCMDMPIKSLHDFIRMLADPYPNAYIRISNKYILFKNSELSNGKITGEYEIETWNNTTS